MLLSPLRGAILGIVFVAFATLPAAAREIVGDARVPYSAVRTVVLDGKTYVGREFHIPGKQRHNQDVAGIEMDFILDLDGSDGYVVAPSVHSYVEFHLPRLIAELDRSRLRGREAGDGQVAGLAATKYKIDFTASDGTHGEGAIWLSADNILLKIEGRVLRKTHPPLDIRMELSDVKLGPQPPALFAPPADMKKIPEEALQMLLNLHLKLPGR